ncbi:hypothetical protein HanPSC8_Chr09g0396421 [Helianthus annuus]|nr:hypothetical protein HanPSC8_Chr09g0396421 [Helianthus annuus]
MEQSTGGGEEWPYWVPTKVGYYVWRACLDTIPSKAASTNEMPWVSFIYASGVV